MRLGRPSSGGKGADRLHQELWTRIASIIGKDIPPAPTGSVSVLIASTGQ